MLTFLFVFTYRQVSSYKIKPSKCFDAAKGTDAYKTKARIFRHVRNPKKIRDVH